jgi:hypothetical protein
MGIVYFNLNELIASSQIFSLPPLPLLPHLPLLLPRLAQLKRGAKMEVLSMHPRTPVPFKQMLRLREAIPQTIHFMEQQGEGVILSTSSRFIRRLLLGYLPTPPLLPLGTLRDSLLLTPLP